MDRKSIISIETVKRLTPKYTQGNCYQDALRTQGSNLKEKPPAYSVKRIEFNPISRVARMEIHQVWEYRTIERYVTQNYQRTPIYSAWKSKGKLIKKTIKLTNSELETLHSNQDPLIRKLSNEIIIALNDEELFPSWFMKLYLKKELDNDLQTIQKEATSFIESQKKLIARERSSMSTCNDDKKQLKYALSKEELKHNTLSEKLAKIENSKPNILKIIFSLGIVSYFTSQKRKNKLLAELSKTDEYITQCKKSISEKDKKIEVCKNSITAYQLKIKEKENELNKKKELRQLDYEQKYSQIQPLTTSVEQDDSFTMLKTFNALDYQKIIGVYLIHNKEKDKYYVGQSKDVMKRIKQHFNATTPKNPIFAEDYYTSKMENKDDLFEIKIIPCETKDELDKLEKELIAEYDSWVNGYNGTSGNM